MTAAFNLPYVARSCMAAALVCVLAACGQRGPLYLPKPVSSTPVKPASAPPPATTTAPAQAPTDTSKPDAAK